MSSVSIVIGLPGPDASLLSEILFAAGAFSVSFEDEFLNLPNEDPLFAEFNGSPDRLWQHTKLTALFPPNTDAEAILKKQQQVMGWERTPFYVLGAVDDKDWVKIYRDSCKPFKISERMWVVPPWHTVPDDSAVNIIMDPGLAFGSGDHPTTRLCLQALEEKVVAGCRVLDVGCGTGILAIAALKLGAATVMGTDIDPQALLATTTNAKQNGVVVPVFLPEDQPAMVPDILVANILAGPLKELKDMFAKVVPVGGCLIVSGIYGAQSTEIAAWYKDVFTFEPSRNDGEWRCLVGVKK